MQLPIFRSRVVPVVSIESADEALPLAEALLEGGIDVIELTLSRPGGLPGIERLSRELPQICVGAGTLLSVEDMARARDAGARFGLSPGATPALFEAAHRTGLPFIPGVMTPSEAMQARAAGFGLLKLFPAAQAGGLGMLRAIRGPLPDLAFCPTGGIDASNLREFLAQSNVKCVGGSWITPATCVQSGDWPAITRLAREASAIAAEA